MSSLYLSASCSLCNLRHKKQIEFGRYLEVPAYTHTIVLSPTVLGQALRAFWLPISSY